MPRLDGVKYLCQQLRARLKRPSFFTILKTALVGRVKHSHHHTVLRQPAAAAIFSRLRDVAPGSPRKRHRVVALYSGCSGSIRIKHPYCVGPRRLLSPFPSAWPNREDPGPHGPLPPVRPDSSAGRRSGFLDNGVVPVPLLSRALNHATSVEHVALLPTWKTYRSVLELERYPTDPAHHVSSGVGHEGTGARPVPGPPSCRPGGFSSWCFAVWYPRPTVVYCGSSPSACLAPRSPSKLPPPLVRLPLLPACLPLSLRPPCLLGSIPLPPSALPRPADEGVALPPGLGFRPVLV